MQNNENENVRITHGLNLDPKLLQEFVSRALMKRSKHGKARQARALAKYQKRKGKK